MDDKAKNKARRRSSNTAKKALVIGFPDILASKTVVNLCKNKKWSVKLLVSPINVLQATNFAKKFGSQIELFTGDCAHIDFGLSGKQYLKLAQEVSVVFYLQLPEQSTHNKKIKHNLNTGREVVEFCLAAKKIDHAIVLSSLDVAGMFDRSFAEHDLKLDQKFAYLEAKNRHRTECIYRQFSDEIPFTVVRCGAVIGFGEGVCPLVNLAFSISENEITANMTRIYLTLLKDLEKLIIKLADIEPDTKIRTLHFVSPSLVSSRQLVMKIKKWGKEIAPFGFDLTAAEKRFASLTKTDKEPLSNKESSTVVNNKLSFATPYRQNRSQWHARHFFGKNILQANIETSWTNAFLHKKGLILKDNTEKTLKKLIEQAVEQIVGFR